MITDINAVYFVYKLLKVRRVGPVLTNKIITALTENGVDISVAFDDSHTKPVLQKFIDNVQIAQLFEPDMALKQNIQLLGNKGAKFILSIDVNYPRKLKTLLKDNTPPVLSYMGNFDLLDMGSVGFCGSRKVSEKGENVAKDCAEQLVDHGVVVVSGYATGVDQATHLSALKHGGATIIVLPQGLLHFVIHKDLAPLWDTTKTLVLSEYLPGDIWTVSRAMQRNKTIVALGNATILIEASDKGGSFDAGQKALALKRKLFAVVYDGMPEFAKGNQILLEKGALPIQRSRATGRANLAQVLLEVENTIATNSAKQSKLF